MEDEETQRVPRERHHPMPLPRAVHELFLNCVRTRDSFPIYPSGPELKAAGFPKPRGGHSRREQFKNWAERMDVRYDLQTKTEVLVYRRTGKIILPVEDFEAVVRQVHCEGHLDWKKTMDLVSLKLKAIVYAHCMQVQLTHLVSFTVHAVSFEKLLFCSKKDLKFTIIIIDISKYKQKVFSVCP